MVKRITSQGIAVIDGDSHLTKWVEESGRLDHDPMIQRLADMIPPGTVAIDAGASIGDHTFGYLKSRAAMVCAFEPNPAAFECLVHNCNDVSTGPVYDRPIIGMATCFNMALGNEKGARFLRINAPNYGASFIIDVVDLTMDDTVDTAPEIQVVTLDSIRLPYRVGFIKADVEGYEGELLVGAHATIERDRPIICMEVNKGRLEANGSSPEQLLHSLDVLGYDTKPVPGTAVHPLQWDVLAIPR